MQKLTAEFVAGLTPDGRDRTFFDTVLTGFGLRVTPSGQRVFLARAKVAGRSVKTTLGTYPAMGVAEARKAARAALDAIRDGKGPRRREGRPTTRARAWRGNGRGAGGSVV